MHILITGANGFIGRHLAQRIVDHHASLYPDLSRISLVDLEFHVPPVSSLVSTYRSSFNDSDLLDRVFAEPVDLAFHLAALPSGSTEAQPDVGFDINVLGTRGLLNRLRAQDNHPRLVFASSIAVYGKPGPAPVTDDTAPNPSLSYGAQKVMGEALVNDYSRREWIAGCAVRIPGIVTRPPEPNGAVSIFFSDLIRELNAGRSCTCPVSREARSWLMSIQCCVDNLLLGASMELGEYRPWVLPATHISMEELVNAIGLHSGNADIESLVSYEPDPWVEFNFGSYPPLHCPRAEAQGFRRDENPAALVAASLSKS